VLPVLHDLRAAPLERLELTLRPLRRGGGGGDDDDGDDPDWGCLRHLASLAGLTQLTLLEVDVMHGPRAPCLTGAELAGLSATTRLVSLTLWGFPVDDAGTRLIAALPHLTELRASPLEPDGDLRHLASSWLKLTLGYVRTHAHLAWLPLTRPCTLRVTSDRQEEGIEWSLPLPTPADIIAAVHDAACWRARGSTAGAPT
jgi:hypothetical protein